MSKAMSNRDKVPNEQLNKQFKTTGGKSVADCKCFNHSRTDGQCKRKLLKTRKERSKMRGDGKEATKTTSHPNHCCQSRKDMCCHSKCHCPSKRDAPFSNAVPAAQEPSIITDSRLIGHHGLFNHEVKSIDIERLLTEQRKMDKSRKQVQKKKNVSSHPPPTSLSPAPFFSSELFGGYIDEVAAFEKEPVPTTEASCDCQQKGKKILQSNCQGSDITPGQRPQKQLDLSTGSHKSSLDVVMKKSKKASPVLSGMGGESQLTPTCVGDAVKTVNKRLKRHVLSTQEQTPKNQDPPAHQTPVHGLSPGSLQLSSPASAGAGDISDRQCRRKNLNSVSESVSAVAAHLCCSLQLPLLTKRNLVAESRAVLLHALQESHGHRLQENLLEVQRCLSFGPDCSREVQDQNPKRTLLDEDDLSSTDAFPADTTLQSGFGTQKTTAWKMTGTKCFKLKSSPQPHQIFEKTTGWLTSPMETSVSLLEDLFVPSCSPQFCMDFEPSTASSDHVFAPSPTSCWGEKHSAPQHQDDCFNRKKCTKSVVFDCFESSFTNGSRSVREGSSGLQCRGRTIQPFFPFKADGYSTEPRQFPPEENSFEAGQCCSASAFTAQIPDRQQINHQPFSQFSHRPSRPNHHSDMINYPPSHMIDKGPASSLSSFLSPEHWSFPPMRLY